MKVKQTLLALGAFFVIAVGISGCGSGVPGNSVADVAGNSITTQAFNHWMFVAAKGNAAQSPGAPVIVPTDPPQFTSCIAEARKDVKQVAKDSDATLRSDCKQLFQSLSSQVMDFLIRAYWYQSDAVKDGVKVTNAEITKQFNTERQAQFPTATQFNQFLSQYGYTQADLMYRTKVQLIYNKLIAQKTKPVTSADIAAYYAAHKSTFGSTASRNMRLVLAKTKSSADAAYAALKGGQSWTAVVKKYSIDSSTASTGGQLNNVTPNQEDAALNKAAFSAPLNKLVGPVQGQFGYYVLEITKINPGSQKTLAEATSQIKQTLTSKQQTAAQNAVDAQAKKNWLKQTKCRSAYAMADCAGYKAPKTSTSTTGAAGSGSAGTATTSP
jgi:foldase protein PrsA